MVYSYYGNNELTKRSAVKHPNPGQMPLISQGLDSVRTYQWEFQIDLPYSVGSKSASTEDYPCR